MDVYNLPLFMSFDARKKIIGAMDKDRILCTIFLNFWSRSRDIKAQSFPGWLKRLS